jgi:hypothetical protein
VHKFLSLLYFLLREVFSMNCRILIVLFLAILLSGMASAQLGTKVRDGDMDMGTPLVDFAPIGAISGLPVGGTAQNDAYLSYWDIGITPGVYDPADIVYLQFGSAFFPPASRIVRENNIRLNDWSGHPAGSTVQPVDGDIGQHLLPIVDLFGGAVTSPFPAGAATGFYFMDMTGDGFSLDDPVYLKSGAPGLAVGQNDIRIAQFPGTLPGTRVNLADPDAGLPLDPFDLGNPGIGVGFGVIPPTGGPAATGPGIYPVAKLSFFNQNGNVDSGTGAPIYDAQDQVYFDIMPLNVASVGDVRLT